MQDTRTEFDIAVIGGGPAGTSAAITAARAGARVALFDAGAFPRRHGSGRGDVPRRATPHRTRIGRLRNRSIAVAARFDASHFDSVTEPRLQGSPHGRVPAVKLG